MFSFVFVNWTKTTTGSLQFLIWIQQVQILQRPAAYHIFSVCYAKDKNGHDRFFYQTHFANHISHGDEKRVVQ